jgi:UPF0755 protein
VYRIHGRDKRLKRSSWLKRVILVCGGFVLVLVLATVVIWQYYEQTLKPVSANASAQTITIDSGASPTQIANLLHNKGIIRSAWTFEAYMRREGVGAELQAGTYSLSGSESVQSVVAQLTHGKVQAQLVTILPGQRLDQIEQSLINDGFNKADVEAALQPAQYENLPALVDKPAGNSLEGYLYPDSFERTGTTKVSTIVEESINEMETHLTPGIRQAFATEGLSTYQGIIVASVVQQEVNTPSDMAQAAQVFLKRISMGMPLGSDVTALYGSRLAGQIGSLTYNSPYNTLLNTGLPPTPISNVTQAALNAVAHPANTSWLYFVTGDNGTTYFTQTLQQQQQLAQQYCHKLCANE